MKNLREFQVRYVKTPFELAELLHQLQSAWLSFGPWLRHFFPPLLIYMWHTSGL